MQREIIARQKRRLESALAAIDEAQRALADESADRWQTGMQSTPAAPAGLQSGQSSKNSAGQRVPFLGRKVPTVHPDHHASSLSPELRAKNSRLLFVSDYGTNDVYIFKLPALTLLGTLTGFNGPQGECSDKIGHVWVTDTGSSQIFEYAHDGTLINTLTDPSGSPASCAWDKTTGNLAVTNFSGPGSSAGNVLVYTEASGTPAEYTNPAQYYYYLAGYDPNGNLYFDGQDASQNFMLSVLPKGNTSAITINVSGGTIYWPGMVQWSPSGYLSVGDQVCDNAETTCIYHVAVAGSSGTITGKTTLLSTSDGPVCEMVQGDQLKNVLVGSDNDNLCGNTSTTNRWPYPAGGAPTASSTATENYPEGAAISQ